MQNVRQHTAPTQASVNLPSDLINIPTYSFASSSTSPTSFATTTAAAYQRLVYTPNISQPEYHHHYSPNNVTYENSYNNSPGYAPYPEQAGSVSYSSQHTYLAATPLSPESHQGFTNLNISTNTFHDMDNDLGNVNMENL